MSLSGTITHIQRFSLHDGPGVRTTVFMKGCPLRCAWCHNPETIQRLPQLTYNSAKCIGCKTCLKVCPSQALSMGENGLAHNEERCKQCFDCAEVCPSKALTVCGKVWTVEKLMGEVLTDRGMYDNSGGGVTFSGGEPSQQPAFVGQMLDCCREERIHTALDTCGFSPAEAFCSLALKADLVLFDVKYADSAKHQQYTGVPNERILDNLRRLDGLGKAIEIRVPVIPEVNDKNGNLAAVAEIVRPLRNVKRVVLLGYHPLGLSKRVGFGGAETAVAFRQPSKEQMAGICVAMQNALPGLTIIYR